MRLPTLDADGWTIRSGEESHRANPDTFWIPPTEERGQLRRGDAARLMVAIENRGEKEQPNVTVERMWAIVAERVGELYIGILDNQLVSLQPGDDTYLCFGAEVPFGPEHVIDIGHPPADYVDWQLGQRPEQTWPRD